MFTPCTSEVQNVGRKWVSERNRPVHSRDWQHCLPNKSSAKLVSQKLRSLLRIFFLDMVKHQMSVSKWEGWGSPSTACINHAFPQPSLFCGAMCIPRDRMEQLLNTINITLSGLVFTFLCFISCFAWNDLYHKNTIYLTGFFFFFFF